MSACDKQKSPKVFWNKVKNFLRPHRSYSERMRLTRELDVTAELIDLNKVINLTLSKQVGNASLKYIINRDAQDTLSYSLVVLGTLLSALVAMSLAAFTYVSWSNKSIQISVSTASFAIILFMLSISAVWVGLSFYRNNNSKVFCALPVLHENSFAITGIEKTWSEFYPWAVEMKPKLYVPLMNEEYMSLPDDFWTHEASEEFVLGDDRHRARLVSEATIATSPLKIKKDDWDSFLLATVEQKVEKIDESKKCEIEQNASSQEKSAQYPHSRKSHRLEMMVQDRKYFKRYFDLNVNVGKLKEADLACHQALVLMEENFSNLNLFFKPKIERGNLPKEESEWLVSFDKSMIAVLNAGPGGKPSRFNTLRINGWRKMKSYLQEMEIISEEELSKYLSK